MSQRLRLHPVNLFRSASPFVHDLVLTVERLTNQFIGQPLAKSGLDPYRHGLMSLLLSPVVADRLPRVCFADRPRRGKGCLLGRTSMLTYACAAGLDCPSRLVSHYLAIRGNVKRRICCRL
jgi:hypothetical protein